MNPSLYMIAGEASGDGLGAGLMAALKARLPEARFYGVGGEKMEREGLASLFPYHELSLMGFVELLPHLMQLMARINLVVEDVLLKKPAAVITIDSPGFTFRVAQKLRAAGYKGKLVHYVAPTVWAYKPERARKTAALFDHLLCLLPFEPSYFEAEGLASTFVGHPVADAPKGDRAAFRAKYNLPEDVTVLALLPGSRENEIKRHMPVFGQAVAQLAALHPQLALAVPVQPRLLPLVGSYFIDCPYRAVLVAEEADRRDALAAADIALTKSGTIALEVARAGVAQVVAYRAHPVSAWLVKRMLRAPYVTLINIMAGREVIPEFLQERCTPEALSGTLSSLLSDAGMRAEQVSVATKQLERMRRADGRAPAEVAAEAVMPLIAPS